MVVYYGKATPASGGSGGGSGDAVWGSITGTLSDQTDLADALAAKQDTLTAGTGIDITNDVISATGGSVSFDGTTINENASNELQALGVKEARTDTAIRFWHGTQAQYNDGGSQTYYNWEASESPTILNTNVPEIYTPTSQWMSKDYADTIKNVNNIYMGMSVSSFNNPEKLIYSTDLVNWQSVLANSRLEDMAYGNGIYVAAGYGQVTTSNDLQTWTQVSGLSSHYLGVVFGNNKFVMWDRTAQNTVLSADGLNWAASTGTFPKTWDKVRFVFVNGNYIAYNISGDTAYCYSVDGETWTAVNMPNSENFAGIAYDGTNYVLLGRNRGVYTGTDLTNWTSITTLTGNDNALNIAYGNNRFVVALGSRAYQSTDHGATWSDFVDTAYPDSLTGAKDICFAGNKFAILFGQTVFGATGDNSTTTIHVYTDTDTPTTASTVYSEPDVSSALTITSVGTGTIDVSDGNTYTYNSSGNQTVSYTVGDLHPNYVCNIDGMGLKIGDTDIANLASYTAFTGATGSVAGSAGLVPAPAATDNDKYLKGDGTWATVSSGGLQNTATGSNSLTILGEPNTTGYSVNIGISSEITAGSESEGGTAIGWGATATDYGTAIGSCDHGSGQGASAGEQSVAIGSGALAGEKSVAIGYAARDEYGNCIVLGRGAYSSASYQFVVSGIDANNDPTNYLLMDLSTGKIPNDRIDGATGSFTSQDGKTVTVTNGVITSIV